MLGVKLNQTLVLPCFVVSPNVVIGKDTYIIKDTFLSSCIYGEYIALIIVASTVLNNPLLDSCLYCNLLFSSLTFFTQLAKKKVNRVKGNNFSSLYMFHHSA